MEYGSRGIVGLLVPQANTTAEAEISVLLGADLALLAGRLTSAAPDLAGRMDDYLRHIASFAASFGGAPLAGLGFLVTGPSYCLEHSEEDALFASLGEERGYPVVSAAQSMRRAIAALGARRAGVVSPYPDWLTAQSVDYWRRAGLDVVGVEAPERNGGFHDIYTIRGASVLAAARRLAAAKPEVILLLGSGMPTLAPMITLIDEAAATPLSPNLCMAWQLEQIACRASADAASLRRLLQRNAAWRGALAARFPAALLK